MYSVASLTGILDGVFRSGIYFGHKSFIPTCIQSYSLRRLISDSLSQVNYLDASGGLGHDSDQSSYQQSDEEVSEEDSDDDEIEFTGEEWGLYRKWEGQVVD